ncbi:MAG: hypothetical protein GX640_18695 [Fibrobacter sp.]|nr:hypothetical protein [Fibrobacter sp.]
MQRVFFLFVKSTIPVLLLLFSSCMLPSVGSISPPIRIHSIIPLQRVSIWDYEAHLYGSSGELIPSENIITLSIDNAWVLKEDGTLEYSTFDEQSNSNNICFSYKWQNQENGLIVQYKSTGIPGIYIIGTYTFNSKVIFPVPKLWLAYPADQGFTYTLSLDSDTDSSRFIKMEVASVKDTFCLSDFNVQSISGLTFLECYLYKESISDTIYYYYYNPEYGALGFQQIYRNQLRKSYILRSFKHL